MKKLGVVIKTDSFKFDERLRKEVEYLKCYFEVEIFAILDSNKNERGINEFNVKFETFKRVFNPNNKNWFLLLVESLNFYFRIINKLNSKEIIWVHNEFSFFLLLFINTKNKILIWNLHEYPQRFHTFLGKKFFKFIEKKIHKIVHANNFRLKEVQVNFETKFTNKHHVIRNFPDDVFIGELHKSEAFNNFNTWVENEEYVYLQGLSNSARLPFETISSVLSVTTYKIVVAGKMPHAYVLEKLLEVYGENDMSRIFFTGMLGQEELPFFIRGAKFSVILYKSNTINQKFCEPNRLFNCLALGIPVIVGSNPSMKKEVDKMRLGVVLKSDGEKIEDLKSGILKLLNDYAHFKANAQNYAFRFNWSNNIPIIEKISNLNV